MVLALKEPAGIFCHTFEAFSRGWVLLELEMISFPPIIFKLFFRVPLDLLIFQECFYVLFSSVKSENEEQWILFRKPFFDQCSEQLRPLFQFISVVFLASILCSTFLL